MSEQRTMKCKQIKMIGGGSKTDFSERHHAYSYGIVVCQVYIHKQTNAICDRV